MDMRIYFPGNKRVNAEYKGLTIQTDQPVQGGGDGSAPSPFDLFMASIGTCAGIYVLGFCQSRKIPTEGVELIQRMEHAPETHMVSKVSLEIRVPKTFPEKYYDSLVKVAGQC